MKYTSRCSALLVAMLFCIAPALAQKKGTGFILDLPSLKATPYKAKLTLGSYRSIVESASLEKYAPTPGDQRNYGTCVAFATAYHLRTILWAKQNNITDRAQIDNNIFSPTFIYEQIKDEQDQDCQGGSNPILALELMKNVGIATLNTLPYSCGGDVTIEALLEGMDFRISDYQVLFMPDEADNSVKINTTKKALAEGYPVLLGFIVAESFYDAGANWAPTATDNGPSGDHGRHALCVVGFDDNKNGGSFRIMNSWGPKWGDGGYVWVKYEDYAKYALVALQAYPAPLAEPDLEPNVEPVQPDPVNPEPPKPEPIPDPEPETVVLEGKVVFTKNTGEAMPASRILTRNLVVEEEHTDERPDYKEDLVAYRMNDAYASGTKFRFFITTNTESYIYAFATDLKGKVNKILPFDDLMSPHIGPNSTVAFPSETKIVKMDETPGTDYMMILYSPAPLDTKEMLAKMNASPGGLSGKIAAALGDKLMLPSDIKYGLNDISFKVDGAKTGIVVPLMVEITHR